MAEGGISSEDTQSKENPFDRVASLEEIRRIANLRHKGYGPFSAKNGSKFYQSNEGEAKYVVGGFGFTKHINGTSENVLASFIKYEKPENPDDIRSYLVLVKPNLNENNLELFSKKQQRDAAIELAPDRTVRELEEAIRLFHESEMARQNQKPSGPDRANAAGIALKVGGGSEEIEETAHYPSGNPIKSERSSLSASRPLRRPQKLG